jgi:hypothetical protein
MTVELIEAIGLWIVAPISIVAVIAIAVWRDTK